MDGLCVLCDLTQKYCFRDLLIDEPQATKPLLNRCCLSAQVNRDTRPFLLVRNEHMAGTTKRVRKVPMTTPVVAAAPVVSPPPAT